MISNNLDNYLFQKNFMAGVLAAEPTMCIT